MVTGQFDDAEVAHHAQGEAALFLLEAVLLVLIEEGVLTCDQLVSAVEAAIRTKRQMAIDGLHPDVSSMAAGLATRVANSLLVAGKEKTPPPRMSS